MELQVDPVVGTAGEDGMVGDLLLAVADGFEGFDGGEEVLGMDKQVKVGHGAQGGVWVEGLGEVGALEDDDGDGGGGEGSKDAIQLAEEESVVGGAEVVFMGESLAEVSG